MTTPGTGGRNRSTPADATLTVRRSSALARATGRDVTGGETEPTVAIGVEVACLVGVEAQQHIERREHKRSLAVEQAEVGERLERDRVENREHPAIHQERDGSDMSERDRQRF